eukprot:scaffold18463_cov59-Cyclotella_meneghiniana.AAC.1
MSILNGEAGFILEFLVHNGLHELTFESWMDRVGYCPPTLNTNILCVIASLHKFHCTLTVPMSHYEYIERLDIVQIGIPCLQWSPQAD